MKHRKMAMLALAAGIPAATSMVSPATAGAADFDDAPVGPPPGQSASPDDFLIVSSGRAGELTTFEAAVFSSIENNPASLVGTVSLFESQLAELTAGGTVAWPTETLQGSSGEARIRDLIAALRVEQNSPGDGRTAIGLPPAAPVFVPPPPPPDAEQVAQTSGAGDVVTNGVIYQDRGFPIADNKAWRMDLDNFLTRCDGSGCWQSSAAHLHITINPGAVSSRIDYTLDGIFPDFDGFHFDIVVMCGNKSFTCANNSQTTPPPNGSRVVGNNGRIGDVSHAVQWWVRVTQNNQWLNDTGETATAQCRPPGDNTCVY